MAFAQVVEVALTSNGSGVVVADTGLLQAKLKKVRYVHSSTPFTGTPSLAITGDTTGTTFLNVAAITGGSTDQEWVPQQLSNLNTTGAATATDVDIDTGEGLHITMASAGNNLTGTLYLVVGD